MSSAAVDLQLPNDSAQFGTLGRERLTAFLNDEESEKAVRQTVSEMALSYTSVHHGGVEKAIQYLQSTRSPSALIVDISGSELPINQVQRLAEVCEPGVALTVVGDKNDIGVYRDLLQAGVTDYLVKPLTRSLAQNAIQALLGTPTAGNMPLSRKLGRVVTVTGARGGVGATTIAVNLAWTLANTERRRVALIDLDLEYGDCALMLDIKLTSGLREVLESPDRLDELLLERAMVKSGERLFVLAAEEQLDSLIRVDVGALVPVLEMLQRQFHYVIIDMPRQNAPLLKRVAERANTRILVVDQTAHALRDSLRLRPFFDTPNVGQRNLVILNRANEAGKTPVDKEFLAKTLGLPINISVPYHPKSVVVATNSGKLVASERGPVTTALGEIANELIGNQAPRRKLWSWKK